MSTERHNELFDDSSDIPEGFTTWDEGTPDDDDANRMSRSFAKTPPKQGAKNPRELKKYRPRHYSELQGRTGQNHLTNLLTLKINGIVRKYQNIPGVSVTRTENHRARPDCADIQVTVNMPLKLEHVSVRKLLSHMRTYATIDSGSPDLKFGVGHLIVDTTCGTEILNAQGKKALDACRKQAAIIRSQIDAELEPVLRYYRVVLPQLTFGTAHPDDLIALFDEVGPRVTGLPPATHE